MPETRIRFNQLRDLLLDLGFRLVNLSDAHIAFDHELSNTFLALPSYKPHQLVAPHHLIMFRVQLDGKGILDADEFDRRVASFTVNSE